MIFFTGKTESCVKKIRKKKKKNNRTRQEYLLFNLLRDKSFLVNLVVVGSAFQQFAKPILASLYGICTYHLRDWDF